MVQSRNTRQKETLLKLSGSMSSFFSAEELYEKAKRQDKSVSIATVYRFLKEHVERGALHVYTCDRRQVYSTQLAHCHFKCQQTGKVHHFTVDDINFLKDKIPGDIVSFQIEVTGICHECNSLNS